MTPAIAWRSVSRTAKPPLVTHQHLGLHTLTGCVGLHAHKERRQNCDRRTSQKVRHRYPLEQTMQSQALHQLIQQEARLLSGQPRWRLSARIRQAA
jgi:hypothetical protein